MEYLQAAFDIFIHLDEYIAVVVTQFGVWTYALLFGIIFLETGVVVTPFLPGDSLIFTSGTLAGMGSLNVWYLFFLLSAAAILGDTVNYWIGNRIGAKIFREKSRFLNYEHLEKTKRFFNRHGGKTIILARFIPIIRTFAPFIAGVGNMRYTRFLAFNVGGGIFWVGLFTFGGYYFGNLPFVKENFEYVILGIIATSFIPAISEFIRSRMNQKKSTQEESGHQLD